MRYAVALAALVVGLLVGGYFVPPADGQIPQAPTYQVPIESLPPHPSQIVNLSGIAQLPPQVGVIATIADVPQDRWLVVTDFKIKATHSDFVEVLGSNVTLKNSVKAFGDEAPSPGFAFRPGSQLALQRVESSGTGVDDVRYQIIGYMTPR